MDSKELFGEAYEKETVPEAVAEEELTSEQVSQPIAEEELTSEQVSQPIAEEELTSEQIQQQVQQEAKKGNHGAVVAVVTLLFILVIGLCVYIAVSLSRMVPQSGQEDKEYESQTGDPWEEILGDDYIGGEQEESVEDAAGEAEDGPGDEMEYFGGNTHDYPNYSKEDFTGPYYEGVVDCIDQSVSYEIERLYYDCVEEENNVSIHTSYIQLEGEIPGVDEINRLLEENATYFAKNYEGNKEEILDVLKESDTGIQASVKSYVTYNTEQMISIVVREDISMGYMYQDVALYCYNINLDTGTIHNNTSILDLGNGFGQEFRDRSNAQNGISEGGIEPYSNAEIEAMLNNETTLILFYTPLGVELGYNYAGDYYTGWITITMQDYENYLPSL